MIKVFVKKYGNYSVSTPKIKKTLTKIFTENGIVSDAQVNVIFAGEKRMKEYSSKYLGESSIHNVLSFTANETREPFVYPPENILQLGDIIVCYPKAVEEAKEEEVLIETKILELVEHAALHLMGKHHE